MTNARSMNFLVLTIRIQYEMRFGISAQLNEMAWGESFISAVYIYIYIYRNYRTTFYWKLFFNLLNFALIFDDRRKHMGARSLKNFCKFSHSLAGHQFIPGSSLQFDRINFWNYPAAFPTITHPLIPFEKNFWIYVWIARTQNSAQSHGAIQMCGFRQELGKRTWKQFSFIF